jgi:hypothetical protein
MKLLQKLRRTGVVSGRQVSGSSRSDTAAAGGSKKSSSTGGSSNIIPDEFTTSTHERELARQREAYIQEQLDQIRKQELLNNATTTITNDAATDGNAFGHASEDNDNVDSANGNGSITKSKQLESELYVTPEELKEKIRINKQLTDTEAGYQWLAGIEEVGISGEQRSKQYQRNEEIRRSRNNQQRYHHYQRQHHNRNNPSSQQNQNQQQQQRKPLYYHDRRDVAVASGNYASNFTQHKRDYAIQKQHERNALQNNSTLQQLQQQNASEYRFDPFQKRQRR